MKFNVTEIEFDFSDDYPEGEEFAISIDDEIAARDLALGVWEADDEDDLIEEITCATGWCIKEIDYNIVLRDYGPWRKLSPLSE